MSDKKICMVVPTLSGGGAERVVSVLSTALAEQGKDVYLIVHRHAKTAEYPVSDKVHYFCLADGTYSKIKVIARLQRLLAVRKLIKDNNIDIVIPFLEGGMVNTYLATRGLKVKFISTLRNNPFGLPKKEMRKCDFIAGRADANFVQNEMQKNYYSERIRNKTFVVSNPVSNVFFADGKKYSPDIKKLVAIGRLEGQKNYPRLFAALEKVKKHYPEIVLKIYGVGALEDFLKEMASQRDLEENIHICGRTNCVTDVLQENDLFVMSSDYEGMPNSLMEALSFGMPCVSTDCPTGPKDLIGNNERGRLAIMDDGSSLAEELLYMIKNPDRAKQMGEKAREYMMERFSSDRIATELYDKCCEIAYRRNPSVKQIEK